MDVGHGPFFRCEFTSLQEERYGAKSLFLLTVKFFSLFPSYRPDGMKLDLPRFVHLNRFGKLGNRFVPPGKIMETRLTEAVHPDVEKKVDAAISRNSMIFFPVIGLNTTCNNPQGFRLELNRSRDENSLKFWRTGEICFWF